jgi:hypothetical protein
MKLSPHSRKRLLTSLAHWQVPQDYADPIYNYLVFAFEPGSFFTAVLANDFGGAIASSHPANTIGSLKRLVGWIINSMPTKAYGNYVKVDEWLKMSNDERRAILVSCDLVYTEEDEVMLALKGEPSAEPTFDYIS